MRYVRQTQPAADLRHIARISVRHGHETMHLDGATIRNLEILKSFSDDREEATLLGVLDKTVSAMGSRLLREWIVRPLIHPAPIISRQQAVSELVQQMPVRVQIRTALRTVQDLMRLSSRISMGVAMPRELLALKQSVANLPTLRTALSSLNAPLIRELAHRWDDLADLYDLLTVLPAAGVDYPPEEFVADLLRLDRQPDAKDSRGRRFELAGSTGRKGGKRLTVFDESGDQHDYYAIRFILEPSDGRADHTAAATL